MSSEQETHVPLFKNRPVRFSAGGFIRCRINHSTVNEGQIVDVSWGGFRVAFPRTTAQLSAGDTVQCHMSSSQGEKLVVETVLVWLEQEADFTMAAFQFASHDPVAPATLVKWTIGNASTMPLRRSRGLLASIAVLLALVLVLGAELGRSHQVQQKLQRQLELVREACAVERPQ